MSKLTDYSKFDHLTQDDSDDDSNNNNDHVVEEHHTKSTTKTASAGAVSPSPAVTPGVSHGGNSNNNSEITQRSLGGRRSIKEKTGRYDFEFNGRTVYEFEQSLDEMTIYILPPPYVTRGKQINCVISANHFKIGLVGHNSTSNGGNNNQCQWFLNEDTCGTVDVNESTWTLEDCDDDDKNKTPTNNNGTTQRKIIVVTLIKAHRGLVWEAALKGNPNAAAGAGAGNTTSNHTNTAATTMDPLSKEQVKKDMMLQRFQEENPGFDFSGADFNGSIPDAREFMGGINYQ